MERAVVYLVATAPQIDNHLAVMIDT
jgi:hypothetical protein